MSYLRPLKLPHFKAILIWWHCPFKIILERRQLVVFIESHLRSIMITTHVLRQCHLLDNGHCSESLRNRIFGCHSMKTPYRLPSKISLVHPVSTYILWRTRCESVLMSPWGGSSSRRWAGWSRPLCWRSSFPSGHALCSGQQKGMSLLPASDKSKLDRTKATR